MVDPIFSKASFIAMVPHYSRHVPHRCSRSILRKPNVYCICRLDKIKTLSHINALHDTNAKPSFLGWCFDWCIESSWSGLIQCRSGRPFCMLDPRTHMIDSGSLAGFTVHRPNALPQENPYWYLLDEFFLSIMFLGQVFLNTTAAPNRIHATVTYRNHDRACYIYI